ncbi:phage major capsid protein [Streptomyces sp. BB1-1-1]|uniref:phage major capsid protein n=1 Tax=Streptomyces sp. BB1-1-1 TaxID=3074430 RepID=UPI002877D6A2|nr:phage major capsid protein [Streptomyces sp. BB1-1-1]WND33958.1 phage major capsid protein [Streptomyces sp. BB1-1-1]
MELSHSQAVIRLKDIKEELERLGDKTELTAEDEQSFDELTREFAEVDNHRRQLERKSALERVRSATKATERGPAATKVEGGTPLSSRDSYDLDPILHPDSVEDHRFRNPWDLSEVRTFGRSKEDVGTELRARALSAIEKMRGCNDSIRGTATDILERWDDDEATIAKLCLATSSPEYLRAWSKMARGHSHLISSDEQRALERAMSLTDTQGGYLVPFQLDPTIILTSDGSKSDIRMAARKVVATGDVWNGVSAGAVSWRWSAEGSEAGDNSPGFEQPSVPVHKADGFVPISIEALMDEANVTTEVGRLLAEGKDILEAAAFATGTGSGQPTGLITALAGTASEVAVATAETFASADIYGMEEALPARYRRNASWVANKRIYNLVRQFDTNGGADLWERIGNGQPNELLGYPALESEDMDGSWNTAVAADNYIAVFGDLTNYVIADRLGMTIEFIPHLVGSNRRPTGQRGWYAYYRVGADSVNDAGMRVLNLATSV